MFKKLGCGSLDFTCVIQVSSGPILLWPGVEKEEEGVNKLFSIKTSETSAKIEKWVFNNKNFLVAQNFLSYIMFLQLFNSIGQGNTRFIN